MNSFSRETAAIKIFPVTGENMKNALLAAIANWLRKPENRAKAKRTAKQLQTRYQARKASKRTSPRR
ncbi:hypothetical protein [Salinicola tamaricis]|uniref:hypothetical protein n=1 Tax=Salinicola tamaricis TaxID=1771309 RepID=UPI00101AEC1C|nr:hypothetical protein [Salinicola tamaricis]